MGEAAASQGRLGVRQGRDPWPPSGADRHWLWLPPWGLGSWWHVGPRLQKDLSPEGQESSGWGQRTFADPEWARPCLPSRRPIPGEGGGGSARVGPCSGSALGVKSGLPELQGHSGGLGKPELWAPLQQPPWSSRDPALPHRCRFDLETPGSSQAGGRSRSRRAPWAHSSPVGASWGWLGGPSGMG